MLFAGSVGRTDLGGDFPLLRSGIRSKLFVLPEPTRVYPGHGPDTTIGAEIEVVTPPRLSVTVTATT